MLKQLINPLKIYFDRRMPVMLALGFSSGFPLVLVFSTLNLWLKESGISLTVIGMMSLIKTPYSFKWLWAPFVDRIRLPLFGRLGRLRSWAALSQLLLLVSVLAMSAVDITNLRFVVILALLIVLSSGTQDIVLDAYRVDRFDVSEQAAGAAVFILGYRLGMIFSGAGALFLSDIVGWHLVYAIMSLGAFVGLVTVLLIKEPEKIPEPKTTNFRNFIRQGVIAPLKEFLERRHWRTMVLFIFFYRMSDAYMGPMAYPFYDDIGFSRSEIAAASKIYGMIATIAGSFIGGMVLNKMGMFRGLMLCGILQSLTNLVYVLLSYAGHNFAILSMTVAVDNIAGGMSSIALVAYLSALCNKKYTATQYALLSSLMTFARDIFSSTSGYMAHMMDWEEFFIITTVMGIPAILLLIRLMRFNRRGDFSRD